MSKDICVSLEENYAVFHESNASTLAIKYNELDHIGMIQGSGDLLLRVFNTKQTKMFSLQGWSLDNFMHVWKQIREKTTHVTEFRQDGEKWYRIDNLYIFPSNKIAVSREVLQSIVLIKDFLGLGQRLSMWDKEYKKVFELHGFTLDEYLQISCS